MQRCANSGRLMNNRRYWRDQTPASEGANDMGVTEGLAKEMKIESCWRGFAPGPWTSGIDLRDFILRNVSPYYGDESFLVGPSKRTKAVWEKLQPYFVEERKRGVLAADARTPSTLTAHKAGFIDRENEVIVGLQTDEPFK